jgi:hypothetical protein
MAFVLGERVKETTNVTGTGAATLNGAEASFQAFSDVMSIGDQTMYTISNQQTQEFEVGRGTFDGSALSRDEVYASSNSGALVNFGTETKEIYISYTAKNACTVQNATSLAVALGA